MPGAEHRQGAEHGFHEAAVLKAAAAEGDAPAAELAPLLQADYRDEAGLAEFARRVDVATFDFENVPAESAEWLASRVPVFPSPRALAVAQDRMAELPPIDVVKYDGSYWIIDGHNRVGLALYVGQVGIDASVVELVPPGGHRTEPIGSLAAQVESSRLVRGRVEREAASGDDPRPADEGSI